MDQVQKRMDVLESTVDQLNQCIRQVHDSLLCTQQLHVEFARSLESAEKTIAQLKQENEQLRADNERQDKALNLLVSAARTQDQRIELLSENARATYER